MGSVRVLAWGCWHVAPRKSRSDLSPSCVASGPWPSHLHRESLPTAPPQVLPSTSPSQRWPRGCLCHHSPRCPVGVLITVDPRPYCLLPRSAFPGVLLQHGQILPGGNGICPHSQALILGEDAVSVSPRPPCPCARYRALIHSFGRCPASARAQARCRGHGSADFGV